MTLPVELETSVNQLRAKHTALIDAVNAYRSGTIDASKQDLLTLADDIDKQLTVEEHTLLGQVARKGRMPSLLLDFANGKYAVGDRRLERFTSLEDILTFTRSTGGGRFNIQGQYKWVGPDVPRIDYDPVTGECLGLLVEEQRTNLVPRSDLYGWSTNGAARVTESLAPGLDGLPTSATLLAFNGTGGGAGKYFRFNQGDMDGTYTYSVYLRGEAGGEKVNFGPLPDPVRKEVVLTTKWERYTFTYTGDCSYFLIYQIGKGSEGSEVANVYIWGPQLEVGSFPTSYIPTNGAAVTRALDVAKVLLNSAPWYTPNAGTIVGEAVPLGIDEIYPTLFALRGGSTGLGVYQTASDIRGFNSGASVTLVATESFVADQPYKIALAWQVGVGRSLSTNGSAAISTPGLVPVTYGELRIGYYVSDPGPMTGHIKSLTYYPFALTKSELQEITAQ